MTFTALGNNNIEISDIRLAPTPISEPDNPIDLEPIVAAIKEKKLDAPEIVNNVYSPPTTVNQGDCKTTVYPAYVVNQVDLKPIFMSSIVIGLSAIAVALITVLL